MASQEIINLITNCIKQDQKILLFTNSGIIQDIRTQILSSLSNIPTENLLGGDITSLDKEIFKVVVNSNIPNNLIIKKLKNKDEADLIEDIDNTRKNHDLTCVIFEKIGDNSIIVGLTKYGRSNYLPIIINQKES
jgi:hypothetical protein